eukprot:228258-Rhodomonas_salina.1
MRGQGWEDGASGGGGGGGGGGLFGGVKNLVPPWGVMVPGGQAYRSLALSGLKFSGLGVRVQCIE